MALFGHSSDPAAMETDLKSIVGRNVRAAREASGMTQEQLAEAVGRHIDSISLVERGKALPALDTLIGISQSVGLSLDVLTASFEKSEPHGPKVDLADFVFRLEKLSNERKAFVLETMTMLSKLP